MQLARAVDRFQRLGQPVLAREAGRGVAAIEVDVGGDLAVVHVEVGDGHVVGRHFGEHQRSVHRERGGSRATLGGYEGDRLARGRGHRRCRGPSRRAGTGGPAAQQECLDQRLQLAFVDRFSQYIVGAGFEQSHACVDIARAGDGQDGRVHTARLVVDAPAQQRQRGSVGRREYHELLATQEAQRVGRIAAARDVMAGCLERTGNFVHRLTAARQHKHTRWHEPESSKPEAGSGYTSDVPFSSAVGCQSPIGAHPKGRSETLCDVMSSCSSCAPTRPTTRSRRSSIAPRGPRSATTARSSRSARGAAAVWPIPFRLSSARARTF